MQVLEAVGATYDPYPLRRERAAELSARYAFASQLLDFYVRLTQVQARAFAAARAAPPAPNEIPAFVVARVLPALIDVTRAAGPRPLVAAVIERFHKADLRAIVAAWLSGAEQPPVEVYLARAATQPVLEGLGDAYPPPRPSPSRGEGDLESAPGKGEEKNRCPRCGGLPQLSYFALSGEALVSGPRYLLCARCGHSWVFSRVTCAACGEQESRRLPIYREGVLLPHLRVDGCEQCHRYLLTIDLRKDPRAIPIVDELAALPLDLYARERGMTKITANLLGN